MSKILKNVTIGRKQYKITESFVQEALDYWGMFGGSQFELTPEQFLEIFTSDPDLVKDSMEMGFETGEREWFSSLFAKKLLGLNWPCNYQINDPEYRNFFPRLLEAAEKAGYKVRKDDG